MEILIFLYVFYKIGSIVTVDHKNFSGCISAVFER